MAGFLRPGARQSSAFGIAFDADRETASTPAVLPVATDSHLGLQEQRKRLPVAKCRTEILYLVETHATTIIVGETGSGKTTQIPQFLHEAGWTAGGRMVACTQPRRVAAMTVAARVAQEMGCSVGQAVGYSIRFEDLSSPGVTSIKYCTDGVLLREMMQDPLLSSYSVIMIDEAHERTLSTDLLLGLLRKVQARRPDLRVIITSATMQAQKFADFFFAATSKTEVMRNPALLSVEGRSHEVQVAFWTKPPSKASCRAHTFAQPGSETPGEGSGSETPGEGSGSGTLERDQEHDQAPTVHYLQEPCSDYVQTAVETAMELHSRDMPGDILIFLTGQEECDQAVELLEEEARKHRKRSSGLKLFPMALYAGLPSAQQMQALEAGPRGYRKVVVATNIAETSLTIPSTVYVIDSCFSKQAVYDPFSGLQSLGVAPISKASATQRAGRAGRVRPGHCLRLCTEASYEELQEETNLEYDDSLAIFQVPEMQRSELSGAVLQLKALGIDSIMKFAFLGPPPPETMIKALELLAAIGALDDSARLTVPRGIQLAELPLDPRLGAALLASADLGCSEEVAVVAAILSVQTVWFAGQGRAALAEARAKFAVEEGDLITYLNVWEAWRAAGDGRPSWAHRHCLNHRTLLRAADICSQLRSHMRRLGFELESCEGDVDKVKRALAHGLFTNAARFDRLEIPERHHPGFYMYRLVHFAGEGAPPRLRIHPSSVLSSTQPPLVLFWQVQQGPKGVFDLQDLLVVDAAWLPEIAPDMYRLKGRKRADE